MRPLLARADPFLAFHLRDRYEVFEHVPGRSRRLPPAYIVGPQTRRLADLLLRGQLTVLSISFQPTGLHRLFPVSMGDLTDHAYDAGDVIGPEAFALHQRLLECEDVSDMIRLVECFLIRRTRTAAPFHPIERAAATIVRMNGQASLGWLARESGVSERQFERNFTDHVGVAPKRYSRIVRLAFAIRLKEQQARLTWAEVSQHAG
jgi:AraC-like DNA-binding protein